MARGFKPIALLVARVADQKKGENVLLLDLQHVSGLSDFVLMVSVLSPNHLESLERSIDDLMEDGRVHLLHSDGVHGGLWRVLDYGGLIIHLIHEKAREFYQLDKLYHGARRVKWQNRSQPRAKQHVV
jgi:ribosome-associated protein